MNAEQRQLDELVVREAIGLVQGVIDEIHSGLPNDSTVPDLHDMHAALDDKVVPLHQAVQILERALTGIEGE